MVDTARRPKDPDPLEYLRRRAITALAAFNKAKRTEDTYLPQLIALQRRAQLDSYRYRKAQGKLK